MHQPFRYSLIASRALTIPAWMALFILLPFVPLFAQDAQAPTPDAEKNLIQWQLPDNLEIKVLIEYVSKRLKVNVLYDEAVGRKRVTVHAPAKIPADSLLDVLRSILKMSGLALVEGDQPGWYRIEQTRDLVELTRQFGRDPDELGKLDATDVVTEIFDLRHVEPEKVGQAIRPFLGKTGANSFVVPDTSMIVVTDYADSLRRIASMIDLVDRPGEQATIEFVDVRHQEASELASRVTTLLQEKHQVTGGAGARAEQRLKLSADPASNRIAVIALNDARREALDLIRELDVPSNLETHTYRLEFVTPQRIDKLARELTGVSRRQMAYQSTTDPEAGLLIVTAPPSVHERILSLKKELDIAEGVGRPNFVQFYKLKNAKAEEVLATIRTIETGQGGIPSVTRPEPSKGPSDPTREPFTGPNRPHLDGGAELPKPPSYREPKDGGKDGAPDTAPPSGGTGAAANPLRSIVTEKTDDAVLSADPNTNTIIVVAPPAVQGVYRELISRLDKRRPQVMIEVTLVTIDTSRNFSLGVDLSGSGTSPGGDSYLVFSAFGLSTVDPVTGAIGLNPGVGVNGVLLSPGNINAVLRALASSGRTRVMAAPKVLVNDNASATLASIAEAPFQSVNASDTVSTTSFAGYASAGTTITVTPQIGEGDHLLLDYSVSLSSFDGAPSGGIPPPRQSNNLNSAVTIPDGFAVVVGGLSRRDSNDSVSKVPLLGDIPLLGALFRNTTEGHSETTLYAFIRPVILRDDQFEDLKYLSEEDLTAAGLAGNLPESGPVVMR